MNIWDDLIQLSAKAASIPTWVINIKEYEITLPAKGQWLLMENETSEELVQ